MKNKEKLHQGAFGAFLKPEQIADFRAYANTKLNDSDFEKVYEVDYWFHTGEIVNYDMLYEFAEYDYLYGNSIPQPKFAIDTNFLAADVSFMGTNKNSIKINVDGVSCVSFSNDDLAAQLNAMPNGGHATIIGRPQINEWMGRKTVQLMIDDIEVGDSIQVAPEVKKSMLDLI